MAEEEDEIVPIAELPLWRQVLVALFTFWAWQLRMVGKLAIWVANPKGSDRR
jgi:hypothetical protein